jgi:DNA-binding response OmpR family regulator
MHGLEPGLGLAAGTRELDPGLGRERVVAPGADVVHVLLPYRAVGRLSSPREPAPLATPLARGWVGEHRTGDSRSIHGLRSQRGFSWALPSRSGAPRTRWHARVVRLLLVEDDARLAEHTAEYLRDHEAEVEVVGDGLVGLSRAASGEHDLVLLDVMLPGIDGLEICRRLRQRSPIPVIMLTARGDEIDRVVGLELGADDYVPKPFSPRELLARIRAVLRRQPAPRAASGQRLEIGPLRIDRERHTVEVEAQALELTAYQFDLLWVLATNAGKVIGREQLHGQVRQLRGEPLVEFDPAVDRSIDVHLSKVRAALGSVSDAAKALIRTVRGVGYVLSDEGPRTPEASDAEEEPGG